MTSSKKKSSTQQSKDIEAFDRRWELKKLDAYGFCGDERRLIEDAYLDGVNRGRREHIDRERREKKV